MVTYCPFCRTRLSNDEALADHLFDRHPHWVREILRKLVDVMALRPSILEGPK